MSMSNEQVSKQASKLASEKRERRNQKISRAIAAVNEKM